MNEIITTLHPENDENINLYPNVKKENIPDNSINLDKLDQGVVNLLNSINELHPSGVTTSTTILAYTEDKGVWVGSDTGYWYYWDGAHYVSGGVYMSNQNYDEILQDIQDMIQTRKFNINANSSHSSNSDRILTNMLSGDTYIFYLERTETTYCELRGFTDLSTSVVLLSNPRPNQYYKLVLNANYVGVGLYVNNNTSNVDNVKFSLVSLSSSLDKFIDYKVTKLNEKITQLGVFKNTFYMDGTSLHSSSNDRIIANLSSGTKLYLYAECNDNINHNNIIADFFFIKNDDTTTHYQTYFNTIIEYTLPNDIKAIGLYAPTNSGIVGDVSFYVYSDTSLFGITLRDNNCFIPYNYNGNVDTKMMDYYELLKLDVDYFQYLFFTDPHILGGDFNLTKYKYLIDTLKNVFIKTSCEYIVSGGDWLTNNDTQDLACKKLSTLTGLMFNNFNDKYVAILGNHDTNYQGVDDENNANSGILSNNSLKNILFPYDNKTYYTLKKNNTRLYIFDSGIDWDNTMTQYRWDQIKWFGDNLLNNDDENITLLIHIFTNQSKTDLDSNPIAQNFAENITLMAQAYNNKTSITLNNILYDFSNVSGTINYLHCGHSHYDDNLVYNDLPIIITRNTGQSSPYSFDICLTDYTNKKLKLIRIGSGDDREIDIL